MATKSNNTNFFIRFIAVALSVLLMGGAAFFAVKLMETDYYTDKIDAIRQCGETKNDFSGAKIIRTNLYRDISVLNIELLMEDEDDIKKALYAQKEEKLASLLEKLKNEKAEHESMYEDVATAYDDHGEGIPYFVESVEFTYRDYSFHFSAENLPLGSDEESAKQILSDDFDSFVNNRKYLNQLEESGEIHDISSDIKYYIKNTVNNHSISNFEKGEDINFFLDNHRYALVIKNSLPQYSAEFGNVLDIYSATGGKIDFVNDDFEYYLYIDVKPYFIGKGYYNHEIATYNAVKNYDLKKDFILAVVLAILALITAVWYFFIAGTRLDNRKVKRAFIDYIPSDFHLVVSGGIIAVLWGQGIYISESFSVASGYHKILIILYAFLASLVWAVFIEFLASFIRVCKSEKKWYENLLIVMLFKWLVIKPWAWLFKNAKSYFFYQPEHFKKTLLRALVGYGVLNVIFVTIVFFAFVTGAQILACIPFGLCFIMNIAGVVFAVRYAIQLDKIITAARLRIPPQVDYNKLPNSLKTLVNSLQYTRQELQAAVQKAVRDERMRTELITNVSHDLKTPLTSIINYVDLLGGCNIQDENAQEYIGVLEEKSGRLKRLIDDLMEASKITSGVISLSPVNLNLNELAAQAVYERQQEFAENDLELVFKADKGNVIAFADGNKTYRILENLISNAKKYSAKHSRVYCDVYETQNFSIFEIKNISAEKLDITPQELTERFVRGDKSRTNEGNGLGLSIADNLCKAQGGHLHITIDGDLFKAQVMLPHQKAICE